MLPLRSPACGLAPQSEPSDRLTVCVPAWRRYKCKARSRVEEALEVVLNGLQARLTWHSSALHLDTQAVLCSYARKASTAHTHVRNART
jgi:hypothetical protein